MGHRRREREYVGRIPFLYLATIYSSAGQARSQTFATTSIVRSKNRQPRAVIGPTISFCVWNHGL